MSTLSAVSPCRAASMVSSSSVGSQESILGSRESSQQEPDDSSAISDESDYEYSDDDEFVPSSVAIDELSQIATGKYRTFSFDKVRLSMEQAIQSVVDVCGVSRATAIVCLRCFKWDVPALQYTYWGDKSAVLRECGVQARSGAPDTHTQTRKAALCVVCFDDAEQCFGMRCGHSFCASCWRGYIEKSVMARGPQCVTATCPQHKCEEIITEDEVKKFSPGSLAKFQHFQLCSYVESNDLMRWCPGPGCEKVYVSSPSGFSGEGKCACGIRFCLECGEMPHKPASCEVLVKWSQKMAQEGESANWIFVNTKPCPKCRVNIEKNQGCNHMTCSQCRHEFCWICSGDWKHHSSCNRFEGNKEQVDQSQARQQLERYLHHFDRYLEHSRGQDFAQKALVTFCKELEAKNCSMLEEQDTYSYKNTMKGILTQVVECRRVLKHTYVCAYFRDANALFLDHQGELEHFTEMLSEQSERPEAKFDVFQAKSLEESVRKFAKNVMNLSEEQIGKEFEEDRPKASKRKKAIFGFRAK